MDNKSLEERQADWDKEHTGPNAELNAEKYKYSPPMRPSADTDALSDLASQPNNSNRINGATFRPFENLTYEQALEYLQEGVAVKLPEWNGMWFPIGKKIFVFTKDNEILATPDHETYGKRNDWTVATGTIDQLPVRFARAIRVRIDTIINHVKSDLPGNRETSLAYTAGQTGFMWLGLFLADLGADNPYPKSMDASSPQIEKHADKAESDYLTTPDWNNLDQTAKVKTLRSELQDVIGMVEYIGRASRTEKQAWAVAIDKLIETKLWLGQQLNNIRIAEEGAKA